MVIDSGWLETSGSFRFTLLPFALPSLYLKIWSSISHYDGDAFPHERILKDGISRQIGTYIVCGHNVQT